jgi:hypothetical protein
MHPILQLTRYLLSIATLYLFNFIFPQQPAVDALTVTAAGSVGLHFPLCARLPRASRYSARQTCLYAVEYEKLKDVPEKLMEMIADIDYCDSADPVIGVLQSDTCMPNRQR